MENIYGKNLNMEETPLMIIMLVLALDTLRNQVKNK
jgi:hypothetical protein